MILSVAQQQWSVDVHVILEESKNNDSTSSTKLLVELKNNICKNLTELVLLNRSKIPILIRKALYALIIVDSYAKDTLTDLAEKNVSSS